MTLDEYNSLKPGDDVWLHCPKYFCFDWPGVLALRSGEVGILDEDEPIWMLYVNIFGFGKLIWMPMHLDDFLNSVILRKM